MENSNSNITIVEILADDKKYFRAINTDVCIVNQVESFLASMDIFPKTLIINGEDVSSIMYEYVSQSDEENDID